MIRIFVLLITCAISAVVAACGGGGGGSSNNSGVTANTGQCSPSTPSLTVASGLNIQTIGNVAAARELAALPNGDLLVGTNSENLYIIPNAEASDAAACPQVYATISGENADGVAFDPNSHTVFVGTEYNIWSIPYKDGDRSAESVNKIASVRTGPLANPGDGDVHTTTSVAVSGSTLYASMGSSCNGCTGESDPTRAAIWRMNRDGSGMTLVAKRIRNAIALAVNPSSGHLWAGDAGQDNLPFGHPYEFVDDVTAHASGGVADYGWPYCEENHVLYNSGPGAPANCNGTVEPSIEFPAYITHIGAVFYPKNPTGSYAFPQQYRGALLVTSHGSWHTSNGCTFAPEVDSVAMSGDTPQTAVNWTNPKSQYTPLVSGFQTGCTSRSGRPTGITVGSQGSVFVADDLSGNIYRIRP